MAGDFHCIVQQAANFYGVVIRHAKQDEMPGSFAASCQMAGSCADMNFRSLFGTQVIGIAGDIHQGQTYQLTIFVAFFIAELVACSRQYFLDITLRLVR